MTRAATAIAALACAACSDPDVPEPPFAIERYQLDNGLEVILHEDHTVPSAYVSVWYHVGSRDDLPGKSGLAHFSEHMMFEGSLHVKPGQHFQELGVAGTADANASTASDRTNYYQTVPANQLETVLWLESDRMSYLRPALDQARFDNQRDVVRNERRQRLENAAFGAEVVAIAAALYPEDHPYRYLGIGLHEDLQRATLADASAFFEQWYGPSNATLLIAGDITPFETKAMVAKWFGTLPGQGVRPVHRALPRPLLPDTVRQTVEDPFTSLRRLHYVWPSATAYSADDIGLDVLAVVLARRPTGRLWQVLAGGAQPVQEIAAYQASRTDSGEFHVLVDLPPEAHLPTIQRLLNNELVRITGTAPPTRSEIAQAQAALEAAHVVGLESLSSRGEHMQLYNHHLGDPDGFRWHRGIWQAVNPDRLRDLAARTLRAKRVEILTVPAVAKGP